MMCHINTKDFDIQIHYSSQFIVRFSYFQIKVKLDLKLYCKLKVAVI